MVITKITYAIWNLWKHIANKIIWEINETNQASSQNYTHLS